MTDDELEALLEARAERLAARLREDGYFVTIPGLVSPKTAAIILNVSTRTLRNWREYGDGPRYLRYARRVWYPCRALVDFLDRQQQLTESE